MNPNRPPVSGSYPTSRGYGLDPPRMISPYRAGYGAYYGPSTNVLSTTAGSPYRMDAYQSAERRDIGGGQLQPPGPSRRPASTSPAEAADLDEISGSSEGEEAEPVTRKSPGNKSAAGGSKSGKKRAAPKSVNSNDGAAHAHKQARISNDRASTPDDGAANGTNRRKKKAVSCLNCRKRKLKCDRGWPCGACRDRDEEHLCSWEGGTRPQGPGRDQESDTLMSRMEKMEGLLAQIASHIGLNSNSKTQLSQLPDAVASKKDAKAPATASQEAGPSSAPGPTSNMAEQMNMALLSLGWKATSEQEAMSELRLVLNILPDTQTLRRMCQYFFDEVGYMQYVVDEIDFWQQMREHEELRMMTSGGNLMQSRLVNKDNVRHHLQFLAMLLAMSALADLFSDAQEFFDASKGLPEGTPLYGVLFNAAQRALSASNPFEEPTLLSLRVLLLIIWGLASIRGPTACVALLSQAISQMYSLDLDTEPPATMPKRQARDRLRLFHSITILDWMGAGTMKKGYLIREEPVKHPYLFGKPNLREGFAEKDGFLLPDMWLKLTLARLTRRACDRTAMTEEDAHASTLMLQQELDEVFSELPPDFESCLMMDHEKLDYSVLHRFGTLLMIANQLINLHKRYYIQGWLDPLYRTSRDICFSSARRICLVFRKVFNVIIPIEKIMKMDVGQITKIMDAHQKYNARIWFFAHHSVGACLLLQHHYALMEVHPDAAGPNAEQVRTEIIDDLRYTRKLLLAMSSRSQIAKSGIAALARPDLVGTAVHGTSTFSHALSSKPECEDGRRRSGDLAQDSQHVTDQDLFATKRSRQNDGAIFNRRHRPSGSGSLSDAVNTTTPQSTSLSTTPSSRPQSLYNFSVQQDKAPAARKDGNYFLNDSSNAGGAHHSSGTANGNGYPTNSSEAGSQFSVPSQTQKGPAPSWVPQDMSLTEMEALLESALSTDLATGMPVAPEVSFERQADRIGGSQPFVLPTAAAMGNGPMSPFTSAFLGVWDAQAQSSANANMLQ